MSRSNTPASGTHESGYAREAALSPSQERAEDALVKAGAVPRRASVSQRPMAQYLVHPSARDEDADTPRHPWFYRRGPMEMLAVLLIAAGFVMMFQPFLLVLYTYSFVTLLLGTVMFIIVSKFPEH